MIEVTLFLPVADNDGLTFSPAHDDLFFAVVADAFKGCTVLPGLTAGVWVQDGTTYRDQCRVLAFAVDGLVGQGEQIRAVAELAKAHYRQEAVYLRYLDHSEVL